MNIKQCCETCMNLKFCKKFGKNNSRDWYNFKCKWFDYNRHCEIPYAKIKNCPLKKYGCELGRCKL